MINKSNDKIHVRLSDVFDYLNEIQKIQNAHFGIERLDIVKDLFIFSCYCFLAFMEVSNLTADNIYIGNDGETWLRMMRQKTKKEFRIPLLPEAVDCTGKSVPGIPLMICPTF